MKAFIALGHARAFSARLPGSALPRLALQSSTESSFSQQSIELSSLSSDSKHQSTDNEATPPTQAALPDAGSETVLQDDCSSSTQAVEAVASASADLVERTRHGLASLSLSDVRPEVVGGEHWTCQIDSVTDAQLSATYLIGQHSMVQRFAVCQLGAVHQGSLKCHVVLKESIPNADKLSEMLAADWQPDSSLAGEDAWARVARECAASGGDVADEKHSMRTIEGVIEQRKREHAAEAQERARLRREQQQEEARQREEAARQKRKAAVVRDGLTLYDGDLYPVDWRRRGNKDRHFVFYPDGVMGEVVGYRKDSDGTAIKPCFLTIPWASKVTRTPTFDMNNFRPNRETPPGNLPPCDIDGFTPEELSEIRIAALSLSMVDGHAFEGPYANLPHENWWRDMETVEYRYSPQDEWRDRHLLMKPCNEHPGCTTYLPRGRAWTVAELEPLGMAAGWPMQTHGVLGTSDMRFRDVIRCTCYAAATSIACRSKGSVWYSTERGC